MSSNKTPLTPSASPPAPLKRPKRSLPPTNQTQDEIHQKRQDSTNRLLATWSSLALKWSRPLDEDDIVDLSTEKIIQDRGVLRASKPVEIGFSIPDASEDETELEEDLDAEEEESEQDELDLIVAQTNGSQDKHAETDPADKEELRQFLEEEGRWREQYGEELELRRPATTSGTSEDGASDSEEDTSDDELGRWDFEEETTPVVLPSSSPTRRPQSSLRPENASRKTTRVPPLQLNTPPLSSASSVSLPSSPPPADEPCDQAGDWLAPRVPSGSKQFPRPVAAPLSKQLKAAKGLKKAGTVPKEKASPAASGSSTKKKSPTKVAHDHGSDVPRSVTDPQPQTPKNADKKSAELHPSESSSSLAPGQMATKPAAQRSPRRPKTQVPPTTPKAAVRCSRSPSPAVPSPPSAQTIRRTEARRHHGPKSAEASSDREESEDPLTFSPSSRVAKAGPSSRPTKEISPKQKTRSAATNRSRGRSPSPSLPPRPPAQMRSETVPPNRRSTMSSSISPPSSPLRSPQKRKRRSSLVDLPLSPPSFSRASSSIRDASRAPAPSRLDARGKGKGKARASNDEDLRSESSHHGQQRYAGEAHSDPPPHLRHGSMAPDFMSPFQDPRAQFIISQAMYRLAALSYPLTTEASSQQQQQQQPSAHPHPHFSLYPRQDQDDMNWKPSYPSTPHRKKRRQGSREASSSSPSVAETSTAFRTPSHAHPSSYDPTYSRGTLPPSSPVPSSDEEEEEEEETESRSGGVPPVTPKHKADTAKSTARRTQQKTPARGRALQRKVSFADGSAESAIRDESARPCKSSTPHEDDPGTGSESDEVEIVDYFVVKQEPQTQTRHPLAKRGQLKRGVTPGPEYGS